MRYSILSFVVCPSCAAELVCITVEETRAVLPPRLFADAVRVNAGPRPGSGQGPCVGPSPTVRHATPLDALLRRYGQTGPVERAREFVVQSGLLVCADCGRWYPVTGRIPELLPDHLRDPEREAALFRDLTRDLPEDLRTALAAFRVPATRDSADTGAHHKRAEIAIQTKIDDPTFFGPGYTSPFNHWEPEFSLRLIQVFGSVTALLALKKGERLLDSGCGYAWTTEWLFKSGIDVIGVDICRVYLEIGLARMGSVVPHLVVADVETLPIGPEILDAVLAYESFHHLPDRPAALRGYVRALKWGGRAVLAEPGAEHEHANCSVDAMEKYGILEKGMELDDVHGYAVGTPFGAPEQIYVMKTGPANFGERLHRQLVRSSSIVDSNLFKLVKGTGALATGPKKSLKQRVWPKVKQRIKKTLVRIGLD